MAKNSIRDFSATAGSNSDIQTVNIDENCPASGINNAIREHMVDLKNVSTGAVNLETPAVDQLNFGDNAKAIFGAGNDLQIYHDGNNSYVEDAGSGYLVLKGSDPGIALQNSSATNLLLTGTNDVSLLFSGNPKLATTNTGVDITGGFTATDSCTITVNDNADTLVLKCTDADAVVGPILVLQRDSASPADNDAIGFINFTGDDDGGTQTSFATIAVKALDVSAGTLDGQFELSTVVNNNLRSRMSLIASETVFNEDSENLDFRVESDTHAHQFYVRGSDGFIGVGTSGPNGPLEVQGTSTNDNIGAFYVNNANTSNNAAIAAFSTAATNTSTSNVLIRFGSSSYAAGQGMITAAGGGAAAFAAFSDRALKENIADLPSQLANIMALRPVEFDYIKSQGGGHQIGFVAQEVEEIYPDLVGENEDGMKMLGGLDKTSARLVKALQEAVAKIEALEARVAALEA